jgi:hypothetical protein
MAFPFYHSEGSVLGLVCILIHLEIAYFLSLGDAKNSRGRVGFPDQGGGQGQEDPGEQDHQREKGTETHTSFTTYSDHIF